MDVHQARLLEWKEIAPEVRHFVFEVVGMEKFDFVPGQFVSLTDNVNGKPIKRAYSIASAPFGNNRFELCLNLVHEGAFTPHLFGVKPGEILEMRGPLGLFMQPEPHREALLIATGTGVAPYRSILDQFLKPGSPRYTLLFGARYENLILYREHFEELALRHSHFAFVPTLTRPEATWKGCRGRVQEHIKGIIGERRDLDVMLCGAREMVETTRDMLKEMGFDRKQIRHEKYW
ncbi:MAG TPA: FAD-binding oxidoreductase [Polyangiaceae bacterium]|nr:FAD-binding oxidoreductase [Polyangiaceae bacterium]